MLAGACRLLDELDEFDEFDEFDEALCVLAAACVEPGSATATAPAATTLAKPTVAVVAFRRRLPRSRSATARETLRPRLSRDPRAYGDPSGNSGLLMLSVWHTQLERQFV